MAWLSLPLQQILPDASTFNKIHRAIEKQGNAKKKKRLYQLAWYEYGALNSDRESEIQYGATTYNKALFI